MTRVAPTLDGDRLRALLGGTPYTDRLWVKPSVRSTNDELRRLARAGAPPFTVVVADHQSAGRGRMARPWHSAAGLGAYVSVMFRPTRPAAEATRWTLAAAVAACRACRELSRRPVVVKWPNDLLYEGRKLGGTLTELRSMGTQVAELIVGTGINVDHDVDDFPPEIRSSASSLRLISSQTGLQRELVVVAYLRQLELLAGQLEAGRWTGVAEAWLHLAPGAVDRPVQVVLHPGEPGSRSFRGTTRGLDEDGGLIVEGPNAERIVVHLGDSVRFLES